jgi:hypothetical protein
VRAPPCLIEDKPLESYTAVTPGASTSERRREAGTRPRAKVTLDTMIYDPGTEKEEFAR